VPRAGLGVPRDLLGDVLGRAGDQRLDGLDVLQRSAVVGLAVRLQGLATGRDGRREQDGQVERG
jgi:hypothetical protein